MITLDIHDSLDRHAEELPLAQLMPDAEYLVSVGCDHADAVLITRPPLLRPILLQLLHSVTHLKHLQVTKYKIFKNGITWQHFGKLKDTLVKPLLHIGGTDGGTWWLSNRHGPCPSNGGSTVNAV